MCDAGAVTIESPEGEPGLGPLGQVRGQRLGRGRQRVESSPPAPALPLTLGAGAHDAGGWCQFRLDGGGDPPGVGFGQQSRRRGIKNSRNEKWVRHGRLSPPSPSPSARQRRLRPRGALRKGGFPEGGSSLKCFLARDSR